VLRPLSARSRTTTARLLRNLVHPPGQVAGRVAARPWLLAQDRIGCRCVLAEAPSEDPLACGSAQAQRLPNRGRFQSLNPSGDHRRTLDRGQRRKSLQSDIARAESSEDAAPLLADDLVAAEHASHLARRRMQCTQDAVS
jgi:hypothetical protein